MRNAKKRSAKREPRSESLHFAFCISHFAFPIGLTLYLSLRLLVCPINRPDIFLSRWRKREWFHLHRIRKLEKAPRNVQIEIESWCHKR